MQADLTDDMTPGSGDALLLIHVQRDFLPGGALAVPRGDEIVPVLNAWCERFAALGLPVFATRDWHPPRHCSFAPQGPWPVHCVANTPGAAFAESLGLPAGTVLVDQATQPDREAYSGFEGTALAARLREAGVRRLFVGGLATDYCVLHTVKDALARGLAVVLIADAVRAIDVQPGDGDAAIAQMRGLGARLTSAAV